MDYPNSGQELNFREDCICDICGKVLSSIHAMRRHRKAHSGERPYKCSLCPSTFSHKHVMERHMRRHTGEKPYKCQICGEAFSRQDKLASHKGKQHMFIQDVEKMQAYTSICTGWAYYTMAQIQMVLSSKCEQESE